MALKTTYKDDVFTGERKYKPVDNGDGTFSYSDETVYSQEGDYFGAADINATNTAVNTLQTTTSNLSSTVSGHTTSISNLTTTVNNKADKSTVSNLSNTVSSLTTTVNNKADKSAVGTKITARLSGTTLYLTF